MNIVSPKKLLPTVLCVYDPRMKHLVLIDGHHLMYRAYWAIPRSLTTNKGEQVNTIFGMASMLMHILKKEEPDSMLFCFDAGDETFRHDENDTYKDGRAETPDDFYAQIPRVMQLVETTQIPHVALKKYEADDLLASYAVAAEKEGMRVTIVTGDRDAFQLATKNIRIAIPHGGYQNAEYLGPDEIEAKYGVRPDQIVDYKGLTGDPSDNLAGVKGIGPKTAATLLQTFQTLQNLYDHVEEVKGSAKDKLIADREQAFFCQRMAQLIKDIPLEPSLKDIELTQLPAQAILDFFAEMDFSMLSRRFKEFCTTPFGRKLAGEEFAALSAPVVPEKNQLSLF